MSLLELSLEGFTGSHDTHKYNNIQYKILLANNRCCHLSRRTYFDPIVGITAKAIIRHSTMLYTGISGKSSNE
jgi:hypothetical protein